MKSCHENVSYHDTLFVSKILIYFYVGIKQYLVLLREDSHKTEIKLAAKERSKQSEVNV